MRELSVPLKGRKKSQRRIDLGRSPQQNSLLCPASSPHHEPQMLLALHPKRFPSRDCPTWRMGQQHFRSVARANGWSERKNLQVLDASLKGWAHRMSSIQPQRDAKKDLEILNYLKIRLFPYRNERISRTEFRSFFKGRRRRSVNLLSVCQFWRLMHTPKRPQNNATSSSENNSSKASTTWT